MNLEDYLKKDGSLKKQYKLIREIGHGTFGKVHLVENKKEKKQYAVKVIQTKDANELREVRQEVQIFKDLEHPHIVHYKDDFEVKDGIIVVMEYCENGDLQKRIASRNPSVDYYPESQVVEWAMQICKALQYLHSKNIFHRDLKPANIFLATRDVIKLGDFGVARKLADVVDVAMTVCGTSLYISPELVQKTQYDYKSDVWSAGCCIYEIMTLYPAIDPVPVRQSRLWNIQPMPLNYSAELCSVIKSMLSIDYTARPPIGDILQKLLCILTTAQGSPTAVRDYLTDQQLSTAEVDQYAYVPSRVAQSTAEINQYANVPCRVAQSTAEIDQYANVPCRVAQPTAEIDPNANAPCRVVQLRPTRPQRPSPAQISPTAQDNRATAAPRRSSLDEVVSREYQTLRSSLAEVVCGEYQKLDFVRTHKRLSANLDSDDHIYAEIGSNAAAGGGERSKPVWNSDAQPPDDRFLTISDSTIADNLRALGVRFNDKGQLVEWSTGGRFQFDSFSNEEATNQLRYEEIGKHVTYYVYNLLETKLHMKRRWLPIDASDEPRSFIFVTDDYKTNDRKLLVLVHGPGVPRAGQWARKVIMNDSLAAGTQIPWIQQAVKEGYAVIVLNPNLNKHEATGTPIRENEDGARHALYVWDKVISAEVKATKIAFVAHSAGANIVLKLATEREKEFSDRVVGIALADYCLEVGANIKSSVKSLFAKRARNWASSDKPLDTALTSDRNSIQRFSAGETRHDWIPGSCIPSALNFLNKRYKKN